MLNLKAKNMTKKLSQSAKKHLKDKIEQYPHKESQQVENLKERLI